MLDCHENFISVGLCVSPVQPVFYLKLNSNLRNNAIYLQTLYIYKYVSTEGLSTAFNLNFKYL
jgi:hypothetical protein